MSIMRRAYAGNNTDRDRVRGSTQREEETNGSHSQHTGWQLRCCDTTTEEAEIRDHMSQGDLSPSLALFLAKEEAADQPVSVRNSSTITGLSSLCVHVTCVCRSVQTPAASPYYCFFPISSSLISSFSPPHHWVRYRSRRAGATKCYLQ